MTPQRFFRLASTSEFLCAAERRRKYSIDTSRRAAISASSRSSIIWSRAVVRPARGFFARVCARSNFTQAEFFGSNRMPINLSKNVRRGNFVRAVGV